MSEFTARWAPGNLAVTVSCMHGRIWDYAVVPIGPEPLPHFLFRTPWMIPPGSDWEEDGGVWSVAVVPESAEAAAKLYAPVPLRSA